MLDAERAQELERLWNEGWNRGDVATIMKPFARDIVFSSPFVSRATGDPAKTTIEGYDALEAYVANALEMRPGIRYTSLETYVGTDSVVLHYRIHPPDGADKTGADLMRVDDDGNVIEWRCHYDAGFRP